MYNTTGEKLLHDRSPSDVTTNTNAPCHNRYCKINTPPPPAQMSQTPSKALNICKLSLVMETSPHECIFASGTW